MPQLRSWKTATKEPATKTWCNQINIKKKKKGNG